MKFNKSKLLTLLVSFAAALTVVGCVKPTPDPVKPPVKPDSDPENAVILPKAIAMYTGDEFSAGTGHFMMAAYSDGLVFDEMDWGFTGSGEFLWMDFNSVIPADLKNLDIADGDYRVIELDSSYDEFTVNGGADDGGGLSNGSYYGKVVNGEEVHQLITGGYMFISRVGDKYKIVFNFTTDAGDQIVYKFEDALKIVVFGVPVPPDPFAGQFTSGNYLYYHDFYEVGYGNASLELSDISTELEFGAGHILGLDINTALLASQKDLKLVAGEYKIDKSQTHKTPMSFNAGVRTGDNTLNGSFWLDVNSEGGDEAVYLIEDGSFTVTDLGEGKVKIIFNLTLEDGTTREGTYEGEVNLSDESCLSRIDGDVNLTDLTKGQMVYRGEREYDMNGAYNWAVVLASRDINFNDWTGMGNLMQLDINTPLANTKELPEGRFPVISKIETSALVPMTYIPGYFDQLRQRPAGTWYMLNMNYSAPCVGGFIEIAKTQSGIGYDISFEFRDDYHYIPNGNKITGSYSGQLNYVDVSNASQAPASILTAKKVGEKPVRSAVKSRRAARR